MTWGLGYGKDIDLIRFESVHGVLVRIDVHSACREQHKGQKSRNWYQEVPGAADVRRETEGHTANNACEAQDDHLNI